MSVDPNELFPHYAIIANGEGTGVISKVCDILLTQDGQPLLTQDGKYIATQGLVE
jgi:hypothetical protein